MARFVVGAVFGIVVGTLAGAAAGLHAEDVSAEVLEAASTAHVEPIRLQGALNSLEHAGKPTDPYSYLRSTGELPPIALSDPPPRLVAPSSPRIECIIRRESSGNPNARNPSGAAGLGQFLPSTWATTPQGKAGKSVYDPVANRQAIGYMLDAGRAIEFDAVRYYGC